MKQKYILIIYNMAGRDFIKQFTDKIGELADLHQKLAGNIDQRNKFITSVRGELTGIKDKLNQLIGKISDLKKQMKDLEVSHNDMTNQSGTIESRIKEYEKENNELKKQLGELQKQYEEAHQKQQEAEHERDQCRQELQKLSADNQKLTAENQQLTSDKNDLDARIVALQQVIKGHTDQEAEARILKDALDKQRQELQQQIDTVTKEKNDLETAANENVKRMQELQEQIEGRTREKEAAEAEARKHGDAIGTNKGELDRLTAENRTLQGRIDEMVDVMTQSMKVIDAANVSIRALLANDENSGEFRENSENVNKLIQEINEIIMRIDGTIGSSTPPIEPTASSPVASSSAMAPPAPASSSSVARDKAKYKSIVIVNGQKVTIQQLIGTINRKSDETSDPMHRRAYDIISKSTKDMVESERLLGDLKAYLKSPAIEKVLNTLGVISGGRRTRKINHKKRTHKKYKLSKNKTRRLRVLRKYRGGFIVNPNAKRIPLSKSILYSKTSKTSKLSKTSSDYSRRSKR